MLANAELCSTSVLDAPLAAHSMRAIASSHVCAISRMGDSACARSSGSDGVWPSAPSASPASCRTIGSSDASASTACSAGAAWKLLLCPRQYASSCFSSADVDVKAAAMASIAAVEPLVARCLSEKSARKRRARLEETSSARMRASSGMGSEFVMAAAVCS